jgi:hypothetical protein
VVSCKLPFAPHSPFNLSTLQIVFIVFVSIRLLGTIEEHLVFFFSQPLSLLSLLPRVRVHPLT